MCDERIIENGRDIATPEKKKNWESVVSNVMVCGLERVFKTAKYPMYDGSQKLDGTLTEGIKKILQCPTGTGHDNALKGIVVIFDLTFSNKAWVEAERYHWFDIVSSQSTMHRVTKMDPTKQCNEYVDPRIIQVLSDRIKEYNEDPTPERYLKVLYNVPSGYRLTAGMITNYQQLKTIYQQRKSHRLPEWRYFCEWIETLPYSDLITKRSEK